MLFPVHFNKNWTKSSFIRQCFYVFNFFHNIIENILIKYNRLTFQHLKGFITFKSSCFRFTKKLFHTWTIILHMTEEYVLKVILTFISFYWKINSFANFSYTFCLINQLGQSLTLNKNYVWNFINIISKFIIIPKMTQVKFLMGKPTNHTRRVCYIHFKFSLSRGKYHATIITPLNSNWFVCNFRICGLVKKV